MPPRVHRTPEQALEREDVRREQNKLAKRRERARQRDAKAVSTTGHADAAPQNGAVSMTPPHAPPSAPISLEIGALERLLAPYADRGYVHCAEFWQRLAARYPDVDLVLQAMAAVDWLDQPKHDKRRCSRAFLANWIRRGVAAEVNAPAPLPPARPPAAVRGMLLPGGAYVQPQALQRQPDPPGLVHLSEPLEQLRLDGVPRMRLKERLAQHGVRGMR